ncbi:hypothetical protein B7494_g7785 [Chlorociboria aeruginascens]|nr:hypothetical protein B7494_g7785 [Chlorociboria aeruginascens]
MLEAAAMAVPSPNNPTVFEDLKADLEKCLTDIHPAGSFAVFSQFPTATNPGVYLKDSGIIGLPLSDRDAQAIIAASHQAPFGKGMETIVDTSVRNTWEISPGDFELKNPLWSKVITEITTKVSAGLGVDSAELRVSAQLYKLLLYEEGAMFKPHQDSEKAPHMFGTMVIALPSKHEGGEVHGSETKLFETSKYSDFDFSYLAWYSDVTHEVKPVTSGRRLVLTYNLIHETLSSKELGANNSDRYMAKLRPLFSNWKTASLRYEGLKGEDQPIASHLRQICQEQDVCFYLAELERRVLGSCEYYYCDYGEESDGEDIHSFIEELESEYSLKRVVRLDGTTVDEDKDIREDSFIQQEPWKDWDPDDEEEYSGYTGNEGVTATHIYRRASLGIKPFKFFLDFNSKTFDQRKIGSWLDRLKADYISNNSFGFNGTPKQDISQICDAMVRKTLECQMKNTEHPFSQDIVAKVIATAIDLEEKDMFLDTFQMCSKSVSSSVFRCAGIAMLRWDLRSLLTNLSTKLSGMTAFAERFRTIEELQNGLNLEIERTTDNAKIYQDFLKLELEKSISSMALVTVNDGTTLANLTKKLPTQESFDVILPSVKRNVDHGLMTMSFLNAICDTNLSAGRPENFIQTIFKDIMSDFAEHFSLQNLSSPQKQKQPKYSRDPLWGYPHRRAAPSPNRPNIQDVVTLLSHCWSFTLRSELDLIVTKISLEVLDIRTSLFDTLYLPFLSSLNSQLRLKQVSIGSTPFPRLFQQVLSVYIVRYISTAPTPPQNQGHLSVVADCGDCQTLNIFLQDPTRGVMDFSATQSRRTHLEKKLEGTGHLFRTERRGSPHTLIITKKSEPYIRGTQAWKQRCADAKAQLHAIGVELLKDYLGELYKPIMSLSVEKLTPTTNALKQSRYQAPPPLTPSGDVSNRNRILPPITKRKVPTSYTVIEDSD